MPQQQQQQKNLNNAAAEAKENNLKNNFMKMIKALKEKMKNSPKDIEENYSHTPLHLWSLKPWSWLPLER